MADLAQKVEILRDSSELARDLGREAYRRFWDRPATVEKHVMDLKRVYSSILSNDINCPRK